VIGHFFYASEIEETCVFVDMRWSNNKPEGVLHIPIEVTRQLQDAGYDQFDTGHAYHFPMAVCIAVSLSMLTFAPMYLTGDISVWSKNWGQLQWIRGCGNVPH
jgi:hypothetical protein